MEEEVRYEENVNAVEEIVVSQQACEFLREAAKWAKFLSILGFISIGFMVFTSLFMGTIMTVLTQSMSQGIGVESPMGFSSFVYFCTYLILAVIYFFPIYYLFKFSKHTRKAVEGGDALELTSAFQYLKSHYKYMGILAIIILSLYVFLFIGIVIMIMAVSAMGH